MNFPVAFQLIAPTECLATSIDLTDVAPFSSMSFDVFRKIRGFGESSGTIGMRADEGTISSVRTWKGSERSQHCVEGGEEVQDKEGTHACESSKPMRERKSCHNLDDRKRRGVLEYEHACATAKNEGQLQGRDERERKPS